MNYNLNSEYFNTKVFTEKDEKQLKRNELELQTYKTLKRFKYSLLGFIIIASIVVYIIAY